MWSGSACVESRVRWDVSCRWHYHLLLVGNHGTWSERLRWLCILLLLSPRLIRRRHSHRPKDLRVLVRVKRWLLWRQSSIVEISVVIHIVCSIDFLQRTDLSFILLLNFLINNFVFVDLCAAEWAQERSALLFKVLNELIVASFVELMVGEARELNDCLAVAHSVGTEGTISFLRARNFVQDCLCHAVAHAHAPLQLVAVLLVAADSGLATHHVKVAIELELLAAAGMIAEVVVPAKLVLHEVVAPHLILQLGIVWVWLLIIPFFHAASAAGKKDPDNKVEDWPD